ncbi:MAG: DUF2059 domain-containing protein [Acidobacteriaceae bacterium]
MRVWASAAVVFLFGLSVCAETTAKPAESSDTAKHTTVMVESAGPEHPVTAAQVREILTITNSTDVKRQMMESLLPLMQQMMPYIPDNVVADFQHSLELADFDAVLLRTFQAKLSEKDAAEIIAFYQSPAGKHMLALMPQIQSDWQEAGEDLGQKVMLDVLARHQSEVDAAKKKYEQEHAGGSPQS